MKYVAEHAPVWRYEKAPKAKCLLLNPYGVAFFGPPTGELGTEYITWCPLPKTKEQK